MTPTDAVRTRTTLPGIAPNRLLRRGLVPAAVLAGSLGSAGFAGASTSQTVVTSAKVAGIGTVLESGHRPLYEWAMDTRGHSTCTGGCAVIWPPLLVSAKSAQHLGHISGLGTIRRSNGKLQVAVHGHALYFFAGDHSASHAGGQGFENAWFTVHTNGSVDKTVVKSGSATTVPTTSPTTQPSSTTRPTSAPAPVTNNAPVPTSPQPTSPPPTTTAPTSPPPTTTPTTSPPPTTTTTTSGGGGGVGF